MTRLFWLVLLLGVSRGVAAQSNAVNAGPTLPATCIVGAAYITTTTPTMSVCSSPNTWTTVPFGGSAGSIPAGMIAMVVSGTCPATWTEVTALNGKMIRGTVAANSNVGTTGGLDTYTPTGTVTAPAITWPAGVPIFTGASGTVPAQTFTGSSATSSAVTAGTPAGTNASITAGTPAGTISALATGADSSTTGGVAKAVAQTPTFTGSALATHTHVFTGSALATHAHTLTATGSNGTVSFTPSGTMTWPAAVPTNSTPGFAGTPATVIPAYVNAIFCSKQ